MKLIIGGSTGFVGAELLRQALLHPGITSVVGLGRRETPLPQGIDASSASKLKSVACDDFENYSEAVMSELQGADACIWSIAVLPSNSHNVPFEEVCKISRDYAVTAIQTLGGKSSSSSSSSPRGSDRPFRFIYVSGLFVNRDRAELEKNKMLVQRGMVEYCAMRGDAESQILSFAESSHGKVEASVARPGWILSPEQEARQEIPGTPNLGVGVLAAALLDQALHGFDKDTLLHDDLVRLGGDAISQSQ